MCNIYGHFSTCCKSLQLKITLQSHNELNLIVAHIFGRVQDTKINILSSQINPI